MPSRSMKSENAYSSPCSMCRPGSNCPQTTPMVADVAYQCRYLIITGQNHGCILGTLHLDGTV